MKLFKPLKIKVKRFNKENPLPRVNPKGDYIDLYLSETATFAAPHTIAKKVKTADDKKVTYYEIGFDQQLLPLGVGMELPGGCFARLVNRSRTGYGYGISLINGYGVIDQPFCGNDDEWRYPAIAWGATTIQGPHDEAVLNAEGNPVLDENGNVIVETKPGERIAQFEICLSQKATVWQKLRWLFSDGVEIVEVDELTGPNRSGGLIKVAEKKS